MAELSESNTLELRIAFHNAVARFEDWTADVAEPRVKLCGKFCPISVRDCVACIRKSVEAMSPSVSATTATGRRVNLAAKALYRSGLARLIGQDVLSIGSKPKTRSRQR